MQIPFLDAYEAQKPFQEYEIWFLFKAAAFGEAVGWTLLLYGVAAERYMYVGHGWAVDIAGSLHGMLFIAYLLFVVTGYSSLGWSRKKALLALLASVVPYGTLIFEVWASAMRKRSIRRDRHRREQTASPPDAHLIHVE